MLNLSFICHLIGLLPVIARLCPIFSRFFEDLTIALALGPFTTPLAAPSVKEKERPGVEIGRLRLAYIVYILETRKSNCDGDLFKSGYRPVSYTHLTLPTILLV